MGLRQQDGEFQVIRNIHEMEEPPVLCKAPNSEITVDSHSNNAFIKQSIIENNSIHRELTTAGTRWPVRKNRTIIAEKNHILRKTKINQTKFVKPYLTDTLSGLVFSKILLRVWGFFSFNANLFS